MKKKLNNKFNKKFKASLIKKDSESFSKKNSCENKDEPGQYQIQIKKDFNEGVIRIPDRKKSMKNFSLNFNFRNKLSKTELITVINEPQEKKRKKRSKKIRLSKISNIITTNERIIETESKKENDNNNSIKFIKAGREFPLIMINANNSEKKEIIESNHKLNIYNYDEAILYEQRT